MDLSRLRVVDSRIGELLDAVDKQKEILSARGKVQAAADGFEKLVGDFRKQLNSSEADSLLQDFDRVVMDVLCPEDEDEPGSGLLLCGAHQTRRRGWCRSCHRVTQRIREQVSSSQGDNVEA